MSEFKFPPGLQPYEYWAKRFDDSRSETSQEWIEAIQRDAVTAARHEFVRNLGDTFGVRLTNLLRAFNASNTPPEILAEYLQNCLSAFNGAQHRRQQHFERVERKAQRLTQVWRCECPPPRDLYSILGVKHCTRCKLPI